MIFESLSMLPLVKDKAFIVMHVVFKILGVQAFQKMSLLHNMVSVARKAIYHHFEQITKELEEGGGPTCVAISTPWLTSAWFRYLRGWS